MFGWMVTRMLPLVPMPVVKAVARRYVAGEDLDAAASVVAGLAGRGYRATLDILGEDAPDAARADATVEGYAAVLRRIHADGLPCNVSVKLSHLGIRLEREAAEARLHRLLDVAAESGNFVRIDMEDSSLTDATLEAWRRARARTPRVGTVLQSCLRRTVDDARVLAAEGADLRLCKGIYREPRTIAWHRKEDVRSSFLEAAEVLLSAPGTRVAFATHDRVLIPRLRALVGRLGTPRDRYEFQALLGVPVEDILAPMAAGGEAVRWYVPFGEEWYPYATRRLRENPRMATYIVRHWFAR